MNRHLSKSPSDVALARLKVLLGDINTLYTSGKTVLESDLVNYYHEALNTFFSSLDGSIVDKILKIYAGSPADPTQYNLFTSAISKDIEAIFSEIGALDGIVVSTFNSIISEKEQVLQISKQVSNKLGDYLLYADPTLGAGYFFGDSFSSPDRVDVGSSLVSGSECLLNTDEGIVLLPLDGDPIRPRIKSVIINTTSNGIPGSNYQLSVYGHDAIEVITDGEPNTWFEYEKVVASESNTPLRLDLTIVLEQISVINHININPINFGSQTPVKISVLETSKDGKEYTSIKDEVPIKDFVSEDDKEEFSLSGATSKYSGQGFYSFLPRKVQYLHVVFEQHTPYVIETNNGNRLRYAIGIRDINIFGRKFKESGSLVSSLFTISDNAKKVSLWASENPVETSSLADISHFISHDDGGTWTQIQPTKRSSFGVEEIINYNNSDSNAIATGDSVNKFRHKISMLRNKKAFDGNVVLKSERESKIDVVNVPTGGNLDVYTTVAPIKDTIRVLMPYMGSFSCPRARLGAAVAGQSPLMALDFVEFTVDASGIDASESNKIFGTIRYQLPFRDIPNLEEKIRVFYNGSQLEYMPKNETLYATPPTSHTGEIDSASKVYFLNNNGKEIQFGTLDSGGIQRGFVPQGGGKIQICLDGDNPFLRRTDRGYVLNLSAPSDGVKESISIVALEDSNTEEDFCIVIPSGTDVYRPSNDELFNK